MTGQGHGPEEPPAPAPGPADPFAARGSRAAASTDWLRITLSSIGDAVISTDALGAVTFMNPVAESLTGWRLAEAQGRPMDEIFRIFDAYTREPVRNPALRTLQEGNAIDLPDAALLVARDGTEALIDDSAAPIRDDTGTPVGAVLVFRDVTARKRAEEAQWRLAAIVESSEDAIVSKTLQGIVLSWNGGAERLFGYRATEAIGRPITLIIPAERLDEETEILSRISRGERVQHFDTVRVTKDGRLIDISLTVSPVRDSTGRIIGASKVARDITDRKRAEAAVREADRRKDRFIALLAHELRNPLAPLRNGLEVMRLAHADAAGLARTRDMMERQLGHMVRLIDDLLDVSRISQNKLELRRERVLLSEVVAHAIETARPLIDASGHALAVDLPDEPVRLDADLTRLAQVFGNLLTNSAKYTDPGGHIHIEARRNGASVEVSVSDDGIGIPAEALPSIFDMFSQVDRGSERTSGGLGIGLALIKGLVEMHDGRVTANSDGPGRGSVFTVTLPLPAGAERAEAAGAPAEHARTSARPPRRVLVVDDNRDAAQSMAVLLGLMGSDVRTVHDGLDAVRAAEAFRPHVVLMDVGMPKLDGYEATRRIREQPWANDVVIVALTGWGQESDRARSRAAGCDVHLVKPVKLADLERVLDAIGDPSA